MWPPAATKVDRSCPTGVRWMAEDVADVEDGPALQVRDSSSDAVMRHRRGEVVEPDVVAPTGSRRRVGQRVAGVRRC